MDDFCLLQFDFVKSPDKMIIQTLFWFSNLEDRGFHVQIIRFCQNKKDQTFVGMLIFWSLPFNLNKLPGAKTAAKKRASQQTFGCSYFVTTFNKIKLQKSKVIHILSCEFWKGGQCAYANTQFFLIWCENIETALTKVNRKPQTPFGLLL